MQNTSIMLTPCMQDADIFKATIDKPSSRFDVMINSSLQDRLATKKHILQEIVRAILYLTKQGLPLCGHRANIIEYYPWKFLGIKDRATKEKAPRTTVVTEWFIFVTKVTN